MTNKRLWIALTLVVWLGALASWRERCGLAWLRFGIDVAVCPDGELRQTAELVASGLSRSAPGELALRAIAHYTTGDADGEQRAAVPRARDVELALVGKAATTPVAAAWVDAGRGVRARLQLPGVPDGDYQLRARFTTALGRGEVSVPLALYAPARVHVITDRPLYEPGNTVRFRAVVVRAHDLAPIDHRPGSWIVTNPEHEVVLEEAAPSGDWGVVAGSFPLDRAAATGTWTVAWRSAGAVDQTALPFGSAAGQGRAPAVDEVPFTVEPFSLPRFRVDAVADRPFYRPGEHPVIRGAVLYSSGAPVAGARLEVTWQVGGSWPAPRAWDTALPARAEVAASGRFELALPEVPADLQGQATLTARIAAIDPAGDRVAGAATALLSEDGIAASAVTELGDGLVEHFNNRLYLRVTTPDGRVVANRGITVRRAWLPGDRGIAAQLDEDGVASLQLDPGAPVNLVIPPAPFRPAPRPAAVSRGAITELVSNRGAALADQLALDGWLPRLAPCAVQLDADGQAIKLALRIDRGGAVVAAGGGPSALERCAVAAVRGSRLAAGDDRLYALELHFTDPDLPRLTASVESALAVPPGLADQLQALARGARDCLPARDGRLARMLTWRARAGAREAELTGWIADPLAAPGDSPALACVTRRLAGARLALAEPAAADALGLVRFTVELPASAAQARPQPTTMLGYELAITADLEDAARPSGSASDGVVRPSGSGQGGVAQPSGGAVAQRQGGGDGGARPHTILRIAPGVVPPLRLRASPVLARPGETVTAELIRGPAFSGALPRELETACFGQAGKVKIGADHRASFVVPAKAEGWCALSAAGLRAQIYVRPAAQLALSVVPRQDRYRPGERAELAVTTAIGGVGQPAAVGLFGVDDSLGQLVPLPGPDALARLRPQPVTAQPAFGVLDGQALTLGRIRGANAAAAAVLRVTATPSPSALDAVASGRGETAFDPVGELTDRFYAVLAELHAQVRRWEALPRPDKMTPATMARLWAAALDACAARGQRVDDTYGRRLRLSRLPPDLLALTDPRAVVVQATRLTEDVENWPAWVAREQP